MPELPEVETVVRTLEHQIQNFEIKKVNVLYPKLIENYNVQEFEKNLVGERFEKFKRRGKWLIFELSNYTLCVHLRMEGKFFVFDNNTQPLEQTECVFAFENGKELHYNDTRRFGVFNLYRKNEELTCLNDLGPEPWDENLTPDYLMAYCKKKRKPIKTQLLDQKMIVGIGNIYANEICWECELHPEKPANTLSKKEWEYIITATRKILSLAIKNKGTTVRSYTSSLGVVGSNQFCLNVYGRDTENCRRCGDTIQYKKLQQRGTFWCPNCQKK